MDEQQYQAALAFERKKVGVSMVFLVLLCWLFYWIGTGVGEKAGKRDAYKQAVEFGAMYYDPLTGEPVWVKRPKVVVKGRQE